MQRTHGKAILRKSPWHIMSVWLLVERVSKFTSSLSTLDESAKRDSRKDQITDPGIYLINGTKILVSMSRE